MCTKTFNELTIPDGHNLQGLKGRVHVSFFSLKKQQKSLSCVKGQKLNIDFEFVHDNHKHLEQQSFLQIKYKKIRIKK